jgi:hypothetical protein
MNSSEKAKLEGLVLEATANDFESLASMAPDIRKWASTEKLDVSADQLADAIEGLVQNGKLKVYRFSKATNRYEVASFSKKDIGDLWFRSSSPSLG